MCFYVNPEVQSRVKIAKEDIICYKEVIPISEKTGKQIIPTKSTKSFHSAMYSNIYRGRNMRSKVVIYKLGKTYNAKDCEGIDIKNLKNKNGMINEGFHADLDCYYLDNLKCIIPKGTKYYKNNSQLVAMKIKFVEWV